ncbi:NADH-quinone oxidoreductase subunit J [Roseofilum casamattae]|uniref:NADH-quinone oxidoreductase subunit J n=1 Tax=Roseofilum casamattae BLCC-M143 TaxID=3022442 RepID=A0ABT7BRC5_9CYAN|nr:NADH-quinone oxidoreductase subunit J [Roseofilum casamattae]MDJ1181640.1 NADH-quinone oxidoreductase subunit J [Roseofilum casamattae BLCC-M143]
MNLAEGVQLVSFGVLALAAIAAALGVVLLDNIVRAAFLLAGVLISMAGLYLLLNAGFVAAAQTLIYVGAINVLILFAIMLVNKQEDYQPMIRGWIRKGATAAVCVGLFALLGTMVLQTPWKLSTATAAESAIVAESSTTVIGLHFFSDFLLPFELASVLLLMALVGAIILARREEIPERDLRGQVTADGLKLPEKQRELVSSSNTQES